MVLHPTLNIALKAARRAAQIINRASLDLNAVKVRQKATHDFVTEIDRAAEKIIIETLTEAYPHYGILAEESGKSAAESDYQWIIDPLDGTTNFIHGFEHYAISIALAHQGVVEHALIFDPNKNELFTASKGAGAYLNEKRIRTSRRAHLGESLIGTGFPFRDGDDIPRFLKILTALFQQSAGVRRAGAASLDLAYVAAGRFEGFFEFGLKPWDLAAGALLVLEAGGLVSSLPEIEDYLTTGNILAASPKIFPQLLHLIENA